MSGDKIVLQVKGLGHVPSFKNTKMMTRGRLITDPAKQKWMDRCIQSFVSQLCSLSQTEGSVMRTERCQQYAMSLLAQFDDSLDWICEIKIVAHPRIVAKGTEGAIVILEEI
jgi:hypothetical protein